MPGTAAISSTVAPRIWLGRAEDAQQRSLARRADAGQLVERGLVCALGAQLAVVGDREPMRLVAQPLEQVQRLGVGRQHERLRQARQQHLLALLGQADHRHVVQARARPGRPARR